jgi:peptide/nickel transport system substrate-binding protein
VLPTVDTPVAIMVSEDLVNVRDNWASQQRALYNVAEWGLRAEG